jgi:hypothetical protein
MRMRTAAIAALILGTLAIHGDAQQTAPRKFAPRYERSVQPGGPGANRLALDEWAVKVGQPFTMRAMPRADDASGPGYVAWGGLNDLRLFDAANREVPYLLIDQKPPSYRWTTGEILPLVETKTTSGFEVILAQPMRVDRLYVDGLPQRFLKRATLEGSGDREHWTALALQATLFDLPDDQLRQLNIAFPASELRYLRLTWDDRNSQKLPPPSAVRVRGAVAGTPPEPLRITLDIEKRPSEPGSSRYRLKLPAARMPITDIEVGARDANILRHARVSQTIFVNDQLVPRPLGESTLRRASRAEDEASAENLRLQINEPPATMQLDLTIEDGSNAPLDVTGVTALLAPLPWVYFESPDGAPLLARIGDPKALRPNYDIEANRQNVDRVTTVAASWGAPQASTLLNVESPTTSTSTGAAENAVPGSSESLVGASIDLSEFRYMRDVPASRAGVAALTLDAAVLAHSSRLTDLRLVDRDNRQHAYVLESLEEPLTLDLAGSGGGSSAAGANANANAVAGALKPAAAPDWLADQLKNAPAGNRTIYQLHLPYKNLPAAKIALTTGTRVFVRTVSAFVRQEPQDARDFNRARRITTTPWSHADPNEPAPPFTFMLDPVDADELLLVVDEGDNAPLPIASATMVLPAHRIRFLRTERDANDALTLYYGDPTISPPRYDLALLQPYLLEAPASEIAPGPEKPRETATPSTAHLPAWGFWAVLVGAVLVLLGLIVRLLRAESAPETPTAG